MSENVKREGSKIFPEDENAVIYLPKEKKFIAITDEKGEITGFYPLKEKTLGKDWLAMYQSALKTLAKWDLPGEQYRVMLELLSETDFDNYIRISQKKLADELNMRQANIARAIKGLKERNIIIEGPRAGLNKTYRLNPYVAHKGKDRKQSIMDFQKAMIEKGKNTLKASDLSFSDK